MHIQIIQIRSNWTCVLTSRKPG